MRTGVDAAQSAILDLAYFAGKLPMEGEMIAFSRLEVAHINITSGRIIAADSLVPLTTSVPFTVVAPQGKFPVVLSLTHIDGHDRVAYAVIEFSSRQPASWEMAVPEGHSLAELDKGTTFGFPVDSWHAGFLDADAASAWGEGSATTLKEEHEAHDGLWNEHEFVGTQANMVTFFSGYGSGRYACYFGRGPQGEIVSLVADFRILVDLEMYREVKKRSLARAEGARRNLREEGA